jgi:hypothetical protein
MNLPKISDEEDGGDDFYHPANWLVAGEEVDPMTTDANGNQQDASESESEDPAEPSPAENLLRAMITSSVTDAIKIEKSRVVSRAGMQSGNFHSAIEEFYATWTDSTVPEMGDSVSRLCIISHAEESKRLLSDVHSVSTSGSLKANVSDVVASWDSRAENLISSLMKAVE